MKSLAKKFLENHSKIHEDRPFWKGIQNLSPENQIKRIALAVYTDYKSGDPTATDYHAIEDKLSIAGLDTSFGTIQQVYDELRDSLGLDVG